MSEQRSFALRLESLREIAALGVAFTHGELVFDLPSPVSYGPKHECAACNRDGPHAETRSAGSRNRKGVWRVKRFAYIDALRGYAILGVLLVHTGQYSGFDSQAAFGARGVQLFFVASALTLMFSWHERI
jgi:peptidoglycan/LPS O-acetylase OafA/YrhL